MASRGDAQDALRLARLERETVLRAHGTEWSRVPTAVLIVWGDLSGGPP